MAAPVSPSPGQFITDTFWDTEIYNRWTDLYSSWTAYTPTWTAATTNPVLGNGTLVGAYSRANTSKTIYMRLRLVAGTTTTFGSGAWSFTLPPGSSLSALQSLGGHLLDNSTLNRWAATTYLTTTNGVERIAVNGSVGVSGTVPFTWASADQLYLTGAYEIL